MFLFNFALQFLCLVFYLNQNVSATLRNESVVPAQIVGGINAVIDEIPWQVQLREDPSFFMLCGGSIISQNWIVTAAHCTIDHAISSLVVVVGTDFYSEYNDGTTYRIKKIINHESYDKSLSLNDISLLQTSTSITFSDKVKTVPMSSIIINDKQEVQVSGWGFIDRGGHIRPYKLQKLRTYTLTNDDCISRHDRTLRDRITNLKICTLIQNYIYGQGFCQGDSGGPLTLNGKLIGIVSWNIKNGCAVGRPDVYERISSHCDWIKQKSEISCEPKKDTSFNFLRFIFG